jgi:hypothetical protein
VKKISVSLLATLSALLLGCETNNYYQTTVETPPATVATPDSGTASTADTGSATADSMPVVSTVRADAMPVTDTGSTVQASEAGTLSAETGIDTQSLPTFNPADPARQDAVALCESPFPTEAGLGMSGINPYVKMFWGTLCQTDPLRQPWNDLGYPFFLEVGRITGNVTSVVIKPQLRVGESSDTFTVHAPNTPAITKTAQGIEDGITINLSADAITKGSDILMVFLEPTGSFESRAIQWALPPASVTDALGKTAIDTGTGVGELMLVPKHGILHIGENTNGKPVCNGTPTKADIAVMPVDGLLGLGGFVREFTDPTIYYLTNYDNPRIFTFQGLAGMADYFDPRTACALLQVVPDGAVSASSVKPILVGIRPGTGVAWVDPMTQKTKNGIADKNFVIRDMGFDVSNSFSALPSGTTLSAYCTWMTITGNTGNCADRFSFIPLTYSIVGSNVSIADIQRLKDNSFIDRYFDPIP